MNDFFKVSLSISGGLAFDDKRYIKKTKIIIMIHFLLLLEALNFLDLLSRIIHSVSLI
jgi:hypothetical protein